MANRNSGAYQIIWKKSLFAITVVDFPIRHHSLAEFDILSLALKINVGSSEVSSTKISIIQFGSRYVGTSKIDRMWVDSL